MFLLNLLYRIYAILFVSKETTWYTGWDTQKPVESKGVEDGGGTRQEPLHPKVQPALSCCF